MQLKNKLLCQNKLFVNGEFIDGHESAIDVINPYDESIIDILSQASKKQVNDAIILANEAYALWINTMIEERILIIQRFYDLIKENIDDLACIMTIEQGKPLKESKNEILYGISYIAYYIEEIRKFHFSKTDDIDKTINIVYKPIGVCAAITPWNFPNAMIMRKLAPAILTGNVLIIKPSSLTPYSANALAYLASLAGLPKGVLTILHGHAGLIGECFTNSDIIKKISFTGSTEVGKYLYQNSAQTIKKLSLELGGNAPLIVDKDANLDTAIDGIMSSKFRNGGQTCVCTNRVFIHKNLKEQIIHKLIEKIHSLKVGNGLNSDTDIGPLINKNAAIHLKSLLDDAKYHNCDVLIDENTKYDNKNFMPILIDAKYNMNIRLFKEEIFGPILVLYTYNSIDEAIMLANDTEYGLASYVFSENKNIVEKCINELDFGMVGINTGIISNARAPFGGIKHSGFGKEGGISGMLEYMHEKYIKLSL